MDMRPLFHARLPMPPCANNAYINVRGRGRVLSSLARAWKENARLHLLAEHAVDTSAWPVRLCAVLTFEAPDWECKNGNPRRTDLDGRLKLPIDAVAEAVLEGHDERIYELTSRKIQCRRPSCVVELWPAASHVLLPPG